MSSDRLGRWATFGANMAVLLGLLLVVFQLRQSSEATRAQTRHDLAMGIVELLSATATDAELADIVRRASLGEDLDAAETYRYMLRSNSVLRYWEDVHYQYRAGTYDAAEFAVQKRAWESVVTTSRLFVEYWCSVRDSYSPAFANELDGLLSVYTCDSGSE